ncbi:hypothetical protein L873DRAFT_357930 [Choiromyces venosus 120613-1]|uniref:Uncharacterized protein n=1 Tax=Choiromyces venosus 120613-1 TaxID=1336337 RepID=A0A3N4J132_9PEZI|nr:hypothetical protein L873DRAFT_357930 [Choiromyces venosus 120613-1]
MSISIPTSSGHHDEMSTSSDHPPLPTSGEPTLRHLDTKINTLQRDLDSKVNSLDTRLTGLQNILHQRDDAQRRREDEHREFEAWVHLRDDEQRRREEEHREFEGWVCRRNIEHRNFEAEVRGEFTGLRSEITWLSSRLESVLNYLEQRPPN